MGVTMRVPMAFS